MKSFFKFFGFGALLVFGFLLYRQEVAMVVSPEQTRKMAAAPQRRAALTRVLSPGFVAVARVIDGDTIDVLENGKTVRVRFIGINAPETVDPRKPVECFGPEASREMHELLDGGEVRLGTDSSQDSLDKYGRLLAYVFLPDGTDVNLFMVEEGFAREYTYKKPYGLQNEFKAAEAEARSARLGLWAPGVCP